MRDPKDVYCSIYEHAKQMHFHRQQISLDDESEKFQTFLDGFITVKFKKLYNYHELGGATP
jgi:hypothetical protein